MADHVYFFSQEKTDGNKEMKNLLGGKGANLAEMTSLGIPVPPGFTISTDVCTYFMEHGGSYPGSLAGEVDAALAMTEKIMAAGFGDPGNSLLLSVRSGARASMPGMMETVLNIGLNEKTCAGLIARTGNPRFVYDAYRRLIQMYSDVVMEKAEGIEPAEGMGIRQQLEREFEKIKKARGVESDTDVPAEDLEKLLAVYKKKVAEVLGKPFPEDVREQLWGAISAVFKSWNGKRAVSYRRIENIPDAWGTAVNVQAMVFGNMGSSSATGVAFTRNPATGENLFYGEWLQDAQGEDVVAGIRTPNPLNESTKSEHNRALPSLESAMPGVYRELDAIRLKLEKHFRDMQDIEFTIQEGRLWMLQCRSGKRTGTAALRMAMEMLAEGLISEKEAVMRLQPHQLDELLHPIVDPKAEESIIRSDRFLAKGLPAGPGGAAGQVVFSAAAAVEWARSGRKVILVREETNPEDVEGMRAAEGILTARGGMTSHAALVARGWGKCCIVGASDIHVNTLEKNMKIGNRVFAEGETITLNGSRGYVYLGETAMIDASENPLFRDFMKMADQFRNIGVRANADTPEDADLARSFGAEGIGLFRTEHMFYGQGSDKPLYLLRRMILSGTTAERQSALDDLFPFVKTAIKGTLQAMRGLPVTIRLLDPPLHEFVPKAADKQAEVAASLGISADEIKKRIDQLHESNPMMGHRGVRLGVTYPEITSMQMRAILEAAAELLKEGIECLPEIMVPVTCDASELKHQKAIHDQVYSQVLQDSGLAEIPHLYGTMIEIPRAALTADRMAAEAEFFSFGTNDLTQMGFGFSRDDTGSFMHKYIEKGILADDPFQTIDRLGIGELISIAVERGRRVKPDLKIGICGEHGGEPRSVEFCYQVGMNYVSCSPFRVPVARLAAAQARLRAESSKA